jgi:hypothetical protein
MIEQASIPDIDTFLRDQGDRVIEAWLAGRLAGRDARFPLDVRYDEDPECLLVNALNRLGRADEGYQRVERCVARLLATCSCDPPIPYCENLLRLCQQVTFPSTRSWFAVELGKLVTADAEIGGWQSEALATEFLFAAKRQTPAASDPRVREAWGRLLDRTWSSSIALLALGFGFAAWAPYLVQWWNHTRQDTRAVELEDLVEYAVRIEGSDHVTEDLNRLVGSLPVELSEALVAASAIQGIYLAAQHPADGGFPAVLHDAARRPERLQDIAADLADRSLDEAA